MIEFAKIDLGAITVRHTGLRLSGEWLVSGRYRHLMNFEKRRLNAYIAAIHEYKANGGGAEFLLAEIAPYNIKFSMHNLEGHHSLWVNADCGDISDFWRIYEQKRDLQDAGCLYAPTVKTENGHKRVVGAKKHLARRESEFRKKIIYERHYDKEEQQRFDRIVAQTRKTYRKIYEESYRIGTHVKICRGNLNVFYKHKTSGGSFSTTEFYGYVDKQPIGTIIAFDGDFYKLEMDCDREYNKTSDDFKTVCYVKQHQIICKI